MSEIVLVKHLKGAPGLCLFGLGRSLKPVNGIYQIEKLLNNYTFWAKQRKTNDIKKMIKNSCIVVTLWHKEKLVGFGRATSDFIFRAVLWDIVVDKSYQGEGHGKTIVEALLSSKPIKKVEKVYIMTTNQQVFYNQCNFENVEEKNLMELKNSF